ncbi:beta-ketoacyl-ACP synthase II [Alloiococcus sp. CFN-8]|uniref:beta-ketoacyl-ACP synthase II n=1 Tax=Alloiococcus sp. CFN-8 TaxID=3416081 RepID=UPI003CE8F30D
MNRVVITGMGAITPIGNDVDSFWKGLLAGKNGIGPITRFDTSEYKAKLAAEIKDFDPLLYMEKSEARKRDLFTQYAVAAASQAVSDSGIIDNINPEDFGVYFGSGVGGLITMSEESEKLLNNGPRKVSPFYIPMMIANIAAGTIAMKYNAQGACIPVITACATGSSCIGEAYRAIKHGYAKAIIAGGSEASITPIAVAGFTNCKALTLSEDPNKASIPFDKDRSGFVMGEGAGALVLEEYSHAKARGAKIYAELKGYGSTCDAYHITAPHPEAEASSKAIVNAIKETGLVDEARIYINAHGTSTPLNDVSETLAIKKALGDKAYKALVSSTKSMTGHMLGAAGAVEAIAAILALKEGVVPPTIGLVEEDSECDLDYVKGEKREADLALALSISLGFGGHNACLAFTKVED